MVRANWAERPMCAWDTETTGTDPETARIVTSAAITIIPGEPKRELSWLLDPGIEIPEGAAEIHGITTEHARAHGVDAAAGVEAIVQGLLAEILAGVPLVIFNAAYDLTVLDRECRRYGLATLTDRAARARAEVWVIDPLVLDRALVRKRRGKRRLADLTVHYGIELPEEDAHTAFGDALATARLAWKIGRAYSEVGTMTYANLQRYQAEHHFAWAEQFEQFLLRKGAEANISREWPLIAYREATEATA